MLKGALVVLVASAVFGYFVGPPQVIEPVDYSIKLPKLEGPLAPNDVLDKTVHLHENSIQYPDAFAIFKNKIYTGVGDGRIVEVSGERVTEVVQTGEKCELPHEEHICGRPLGMQFNKAGKLYVVDAYLGLFSVNVRTGKKENLVPSNKLVDGQRLTFLNSIALDEDETAVYFTQSSTRWNFSQSVLSILDHDQTGRLLKYDLKSKVVSVLLKEQSFPNGLALTHDGTALLVAIGNSNQIFKYYIKGPKKGNSEDLPLLLPGEPDNITPSPRGTYWVSILVARGEPNLVDKLSEVTWVRKAFLHWHRCNPFVNGFKLFPHKLLKKWGFELETIRFMADYAPSRTMVVEIDDSGKILRSLQSSTGKVRHITEAREHGGHLYLGSWRNPFVGKLKL